MQENLASVRNAHSARLIRQPGCLSARRTWILFINLALLLNAWLLFATAVKGTWGLAMAFILLFTFVIPLGVIVPLAASIMARSLVSADMRSQSFEILKTTTLTNWQLTGGYMFAIVHQLRSFFIALFGVGSSILITLFLALIVLDVNAASPEYNMRLYLYLTSFVLQILGISLLMVIMPIFLAIRFPRAFPMGVVMPFIAVGVSVTAMILSFVILNNTLPERNTSFVPIERQTFDFIEPFSLIYIALMAWPYLAFAGLTYASVRWIRHEH